jgi:PAS domain S-box-containing protein
MNFLQEALEESSHVIWFSDPQGERLAVSRGWTEFTGLGGFAEALGEWKKAIHPEDRPRVEQVIMERAARQEEVHQEYRLRRHDGEYSWVREVLSPYHAAEGGEFIGYLGACSEVGRGGASSGVSEGHELFSAVMDEAPFGLCLFDREGRVLEANHLMRALCGLQSAEESGRPLRSLLHPSDQEVFDRHLAGLATGPGLFSCQLRLIGRDERLLRVLLTGQLVPAVGADSHIVCAVESVSSEGRGRGVTETDGGAGMPGCFLPANEIERFHRRSRHMVRIACSLGTCSNEDELFLLQAAGLREGTAELEEDRGPILSSSIVMATGGRVDYSFDGRRIRIGDQSYPSWLGLELLRQRLAESTLVNLTKSLNRDMEARIDLVEARSRQLQRLTTRLTQAEQRERRRIAQRLHDDLQQHLVGAKVKLATVGGRHPAARLELSDLEAAVDKALTTSRTLTSELSPPVIYDAGFSAGLDWLARRFQRRYNLCVEYRGPQEFDVQDEDVRSFLFAAVRELLRNVVRHAGVRHATVEVEKVSAERIRLVVEDAGKGMDLPGAGGDLDPPGFGLFGLRERIQCLGGSLLIEKGPQGGTRVTIDVPARAVATAPEPVERVQVLEPSPEEEPPESRGRGSGPIRVMLVDDHKMLREGLSGLLGEEPDMEIVAEASDGVMAVELARQHQPDLIIMDISMPRMNGIEATRKITSELPWIPIIGLSMHERDDMAKAMRTAGAVDLITKGAASDLLIQVVRDYARPSAA